jgi:hypothetical protein
VEFGKTGRPTFFARRCAGSSSRGGVFLYLISGFDQGARRRRRVHRTRGTDGPSEPNPA